MKMKHTPERVAELEYKANLAVAAHWNCATSGTMVAAQGLSVEQNVYDAFRVNVLVSITEWLMARAGAGYTYPRVPFTELALDMYEASVECGPDEDVQSLESIVAEGGDRYGRHIRDAYRYELDQVHGNVDAVSEFYTRYIDES